MYWILESSKILLVFRLSQEAEEALCEANIFNIKNKNVWTLLTILN
jgi:hypothetical protein